MTRPRIRPFTEADLAAAGRLLAGRHAAHLRVEPLLDKDFADPDRARAAVAEIWHGEGAAGAVATVGERIAGFLLGVPQPGECWGPNVWVEAAGHAAEDAETVRDLYALAAAGWVEAGRSVHYAVVPTHDPAEPTPGSGSASVTSRCSPCAPSPTRPPPARTCRSVPRPGPTSTPWPSWT